MNTTDPIIHETKNAVEAIIRLYEESCSAGRHHEGQCSVATQCVLILAGAAIGILRFGTVSFVADISISILIVAIGICGAKVTHDHCRRIHNCFDEQMYYAERITKYILKAGIVLDSYDEKPERKRSALNWSTIHWVVAMIGLALTVVAVVRKITLGDKVPWF